MPISDGVSSLAVAVGASLREQFTITEEDISHRTSNGFTGKLTLTRVGPKLRQLSFSLRNDGAPLGPSTTKTIFAYLQGDERPANAVSTSVRTVSSGEGYSAGLLLVEEGGAMSIMAQRSGDDTAWGGITYLCA